MEILKYDDLMHKVMSHSSVLFSLFNKEDLLYKEFALFFLRDFNKKESLSWNLKNCPKLVLLFSRYKSKEALTEILRSFVNLQKSLTISTQVCSIIIEEIILFIEREYNEHIDVDI